MALEYQLPYTGDWVKGQLEKIDQLILQTNSDLNFYIYVGREGTQAVKFASIDYSVLDSEDGISAKITMVGGHGDGTHYFFLQDVIINVNINGTVTVDNIKYYQSDVTAFKKVQCHYGDIFWIVNTTNKVIDFYCIMGQFSRLYMTPWKRLTYSNKGIIIQYTLDTFSYFESSSTGTPPFATNHSFFSSAKDLNRNTYITEGDTNYTTFMVRGTSLNSKATKPPQNGMIAWTYE